jgi:hypothetical protein
LGLGIRISSTNPTPKNYPECPSERISQGSILDSKHIGYECNGKDREVIEIKS